MDLWMRAAKHELDSASFAACSMLRPFCASSIEAEVFNVWT